MFKIIRLILIALPVLVCVMVLCVYRCYADEMNSQVLKTGISVEHIPEALYGAWRVVARLKDTDAPATFKPLTADLWNLSRVDDVINLSNPFTGATASVTLEYLNNNTVRFSRVTGGDHTKLTETIGITLQGDTFTGMDWLKLETFSVRDTNKLYKTETASYTLKGERISGQSVVGE
jgi:hypothetical protein